MSTDVLAALALFAFVSSFTPGPNNIMLFTSGLRFGFMRTIPHMAGITGGFSVLVALVGGGFGAVFQAFPLAHTVLKVACIAYMLYLAYGIATSPPVPAESSALGSRPMRWYEAAGFQWINPKAWAIALTICATYSQPGSLSSALLCAAVVALVSIPCVAAWAGFGVGLRQLLSDPRRARIFNIVMALLLVGSIIPFLK